MRTDTITANTAANTAAQVEHRIVLDFEHAETLRAALEYIGDADASVMICAGSVTTQGETYALWDGYNAAVKATFDSEA